MNRWMNGFIKITDKEAVKFGGKRQIHRKIGSLWKKLKRYNV